MKSGARGILQDCPGHVSSGLTCEISSVNSTIFRGSALYLRHSHAHIYRAADGKPIVGYRARRTRPTKRRACLARGARALATSLPRPLEGASDPTPTRELHYSTACMHMLHMCFNGVKVSFSVSCNAGTDAQHSPCADSVRGAKRPSNHVAAKALRNLRSKGVRRRGG